MMAEHWKTINAAVRRVVAGFLGELVEGQLGDWKQYVQLTYRDTNVVPALPLHSAFEIVEIQKPDEDSDDPAGVVRTVVIDLVLTPHGARAARTICGTLRVIRESAPHKADPEGEWGVCPASWRPMKEAQPEQPEEEEQAEE